MRLVAFIAAVLLTAQMALGQCGPNGCPGGSSMGTMRPETPRQQRSVQAPVSTTTPPEWLCHVYGASGMLIYKDANVGVVLTAYHVIKGGPRDGIKVQFPDGQTYTGRVYEDAGGNISADKLCDVAMVEITTPEAEPCTLARTKPPVGARIWVIGYAAERRAKPTYLVRSARVADYVSGAWGNRQGPEGSTLQADGWAEGGDSGGAMINDRGELAGVISTSDRSSKVSGPSLARIHALCANEEFDWPWFGWRGKAEERIEGLNRDKAERSEIPQTPPPAPSDDTLRRLEGKIDGIQKLPRAPDAAIIKLADLIEEDRERLDSLEGWVPLLGRLEDAEERLLAMDPDKLKTELGRIVQADSKAAIDKANAATAALEKAADGIAPAAEAAATAAVDKAVDDPSFLQRLINRAGEGIIPGRQLPVVVEAVKGTWPWQTIAGLGGWGLAGVIGVVVITFFVVRRRVPGAQELMSEGADRLTGAIPGPVDNWILMAFRQGLVTADGVIDWLEGRVGIPTPATRKPAAKKKVGK